MGYLKGFLLLLALLTCGLVAFLFSVFALLLKPFFPSLRFHSNYVFLKPFHLLTKAVVGLHVVYLHRERADLRRPCILLGNHQSGLDLGIIGSVCPDLSVVVAKKEIQNIPIFGWFFKIAGNVMIDRKKTFEAKTQMENIRVTLAERNLNLVVFPEGTRSKKQTFLPFKKGAFHMAIATGYPLLPVICSSLKGKAVWETFDLHGGHVVISILEPIETQGMGVKDLEPLKNKAFELMHAEYERINLLAEDYERDAKKAKQKSSGP